MGRHGLAVRRLRCGWRNLVRERSHARPHSALPLQYPLPRTESDRAPLRRNPNHAPLSSEFPSIYMCPNRRGGADSLHMRPSLLILSVAVLAVCPSRQVKPVPHPFLRVGAEPARASRKEMLHFILSSSGWSLLETSKRPLSRNRKTSSIRSRIRGQPEELQRRE